MERKLMLFKLKDVAEDGTFTGYASVHKNVDLGREKLQRGAFKKTLSESGGKVPILWQHDSKQPIGISVEAEEDDFGLKVKGKLVLEVAKASEAYALLKAGAIKGLSIGYDVIQEAFEKGVRILKEVKLWEYSVVTFPMNPLAEVQSVKELRERLKKSFADMNDYVQLCNARWTMFDVLNMIIWSALDSDGMDQEAATEQFSQSLDEFKAAMLDWFSKMYPMYRMEDDEEDNMDTMSKALKEGRVLSGKNRTLVENAISALQDLLSAADGKALPKGEPSQKPAEPAPSNSGDLSSLIEVMKSTLNVK